MLPQVSKNTEVSSDGDAKQEQLCTKEARTADNDRTWGGSRRWRPPLARKRQLGKNFPNETAGEQVEREYFQVIVSR